MTTDPYDPDSALRAMAPRLAVARRRRRAAGGSATAVALCLSTILATGALDSGEDTSLVLAGHYDDAGLEGIEGEVEDALAAAKQHDAEVTSTTQPTPPSTEAVDPPEDLAPHVEPAPPPPPPAPKPPAPTPPPPPPPVDTEAVLHTIGYDGAGSMVVEQTGSQLRLVSVSPEPGWSWTEHSGHDFVKVEFSNSDGVRRWLKVLLHDGQLRVERWEDVPHESCTPPEDSVVHDAPSEAGSITVATDADGKLQLTSVDPAAGWSPDVHEATHDTVKVKFWNDELGQGAWVKVRLDHCERTVETGTF